MRGSTMRAAVLVAAACAGAMVVAAGPAGAAGAGSGGSWRVLAQLPAAARSGVLNQVTTAGPGSRWAFESPAPLGTTGRAVAWRLSGGAWQQEPLPGTGSQVTAVGASSATDVWAFRLTANLRDEQAFRWTGKSWSLTGTLPEGGIGDAIVFGPGNVWAFGEQHGAWHYNGRSWTRVPGGSGLTSGSALSATSIWAAGGNVVAHWSGSAWTRTSLARLLPAKSGDPYLAGIYAAAAGNVYAITGGDPELTGGGPIYLLHWNGRTWAKVAAIAHDGNASALTGDGGTGIWLAAGPAEAPFGVTVAILHYAGGRLAKTSLPGSIGQVWVGALSRVPGSKDIIAGTQAEVGAAQTLLKYTA